MLTRRQQNSRGFALLAALLMLVFLSAISVAMIYLANSETRTHTSDLESTRTYYVAEAAMEKMMVDLSTLYLNNLSPTVAQIEALGATPPALSGFSFPEYQFAVPSSGGAPTYSVRTISHGPNQGLIAQILPITLTATARANNSTEVKMRRDIEVALIPVFQFGTFFDGDLAVFPSPPFTFFGRVHTNRNIFINTPTTGNLVFRSKVTAAGEVIRLYQSNGYPTSSNNWIGPVYVPNAPAGCDAGGPSATCIDLEEDQGSRNGGPTDPINTNWANISTDTYKGWIQNGATGAKSLTLPFVDSTTRAISIIKRPPTGEDPSSPVGRSRLFNQAQIRVLLADNAAELPGGSVQLANLGSYAGGIAVTGTAGNTFFAEATTNAVNGVLESDWMVQADAHSDGSGQSWPLINGYLVVQARQSDGSYSDVTQEWLQLGFARGLVPPNSESGVANGVHPNAILILQQQADRNGNGFLLNNSATNAADTASGESTVFADAAAKNNFYPINLYDPRQGEWRSGGTNGTCSLAGIINTVEIDVRNLKLWLDGTIGATGTNTESASQNGYILYFSDRRGMLTNGAGQKVGEFGFEDTINSADPNGVPDGALEAAEDVNDNGVLDNYGRSNLGDGFIIAAQGGDTVYDIPFSLSITYRVNGSLARKNRVSGARHALTLMNGSLGNLPRRPGGTGGFTVSAENPVYVKGNYNATNGGFGTPNAAASIIADAVITLSNSWLDLNSFINSTNTNGRVGSTTWNRMAIATGKNNSFSNPGWALMHWGTDGGVIVFTSYSENWGGQTHHYMGSFVNLFPSEYNTGIYNGYVYGAPARDYNFDTNFLNPDQLPPGTPRFQDLVNLGYRQVFTP